jgi:hypothetical protein
LGATQVTLVGPWLPERRKITAWHFLKCAYIVPFTAKKSEAFQAMRATQRSMAQHLPPECSPQEIRKETAEWERQQNQK